MAKVRSHVVSRPSCAVVARELGLGERLLERGAGLPAEELDRLSRNRNVLAAVLEAALAALYLEHGFEPIEQRSSSAFEGRDRVRAHEPGRPQDRAQETLARRGRAVALVAPGRRGAAARADVHGAAA